MNSIADKNGNTKVLETVQRTFDGYNGNATTNVGGACINGRLYGTVVVRKSGALPVAVGFYKDKQNPSVLAQVRLLPGDIVFEFDGKYLTEKAISVTMLRVVSVTPSISTCLVTFVKVKDEKEKVAALKNLPPETRLALKSPNGLRGRPFVVGPRPRIGVS